PTSNIQSPAAGKILSADRPREIQGRPILEHQLQGELDLARTVRRENLSCGRRLNIGRRVAETGRVGEIEELGSKLQSGLLGNPLEAEVLKEPEVPVGPAGPAKNVDPAIAVSELARHFERRHVEPAVDGRIGKVASANSVGPPGGPGIGWIRTDGWGERKS